MLVSCQHTKHIINNNRGYICTSFVMSHVTQNDTNMTLICSRKSTKDSLVNNRQSDAMKTSGRSNFTWRPYYHRTQMVQSCSPGCTNTHSHLTHAYLDPPESISQGASWSVQLFLHSSRQTIPKLQQWATPFPLKTAPSHWGFWAHLINSFWAPPKWTSQNGILIGSAVVCKAHNHGRPTDRPHYSVCNNRPHLRT